MPAAQLSLQLGRLVPGLDKRRLQPNNVTRPMR
jgi:hypothetical protein